MKSAKTFSPHSEPEGWFFRTPDQGVAATLMALAFSFSGVERYADQGIVFVFQWSGDLDGTVASYWTDQLAVNARALVRSLQEIQLMAEAWASGGDHADAS